uniref:SAM domain-containing protein n=1 Tax=Catharus ustulatus TaxID=91951 RepID=A0A8C3V9K7_CATUS
MATSEWLRFFEDAGIPPGPALGYAVAFVDNRIHKNMLLDLTKELMKELGITVVGDIIAILRHAKVVHRQEMCRAASQSLQPEAGSERGAGGSRRDPPDHREHREHRDPGGAAGRMITKSLSRDPARSGARSAPGTGGTGIGSTGIGGTGISVTVANGAAKAGPDSLSLPSKRRRVTAEMEGESLCPCPCPCVPVPVHVPISVPNSVPVPTRPGLSVPAVQTPPCDRRDGREIPVSLSLCPCPCVPLPISVPISVPNSVPVPTRPGFSVPAVQTPPRHGRDGGEIPVSLSLCPCPCVPVPCPHSVPVPTRPGLSVPAVQTPPCDRRDGGEIRDQPAQGHHGQEPQNPAAAGGQRSGPHVGVRAPRSRGQGGCSCCREALGGFQPPGGRSGRRRSRRCRRRRGAALRRRAEETPRMFRKRRRPLRRGPGRGRVQLGVRGVPAGLGLRQGQQLLRAPGGLR